MQFLKSALVGISVALIAYGAAFGIGNINDTDKNTDKMALSAVLAPTLAPSGTTLAPSAKKVAPTLAPSGTTLAPSVIPRISMTSTPSPSLVLSPTPLITVIPRIITPTPIPTLATTPSPTPTPTPTPSDPHTPTPTSGGSPRVVINEIAWMGTGADTNDEWIELYNSGDGDADLSGWTLRAQDGSPKISLLGSILAHGYYLMERTSSSSTDMSEDLVYTGSLENGGEILELCDASGQIRDSVDVWYAGDNASKSSMERINPMALGNDPTNWGTNNGLITTGLDAVGNHISGTPKYKNSVSTGL